MLLPVAGCFAALLLLLGIWQRGIERREGARIVEEIRGARESGKDRAVAQYPHIESLLCIGCSSCIRACPEDGVIGLVDGVAHVVAASRCVGHGRCEEACPVGALEVGLGDISDRSDLPRLTDELESTVPGLFIAGELGGIALIRNAVEQGVRVVDTIGSRLGKRRGRGGALDLLIVGSGPAGLAASLKATELGLDYLTIDQSGLGGTVRKYPRRKLVLTQPVDLPLHGRLKRHEYRKETLVEMFESIVERHKVRLRTGVKMNSLVPGDGGFEVSTSAGPLRSRFVALALGRRGTPRRLGVEGEEHEKVLYQLMDAATYSHERLLVVGGGDSAIEAAIGLADQSGNRVTLSYRKHAFFRLKPRNEERIRSYSEQGLVSVQFSSRVKRIDPQRVALLREQADETEIENDYVFVFAGGEPPYPLLRQAGVGFWGSGS